jgi:hypothetical protein
MKTAPSLATVAALFAGTGLSHATLATWQAAVGTGAAPAVTHYTTVSGAAPITINVGTLTGDRSFEFIYNAGIGGASQALLGSQDPASGGQGLKVDQWQNTGVYGITDFGVLDYSSDDPYLLNQDVHIVFTSNGVDTNMFLNGLLVHTFGGVDLTITGFNGIGAADNAAHTAYFDLLAGNIFGFVSYDSELSSAEVLDHYNAFIIPEPAAAALAALAGLSLAGRRRRQ